MPLAYGAGSINSETYNFQPDLGVIGGTVIMREHVQI